MIVYDAGTRKIRAVVVTKYSLTCVDVSNDSNLIAIGCSNGYVLIYDLGSNRNKGFRLTASSNNFSHTIKDRFVSITCVRFSKCNNWLSVGAEDSVIINYHDLSMFQEKSRMSHHKAAVTHIDIDDGSEYI